MKSDGHTQTNPTTSGEQASIPQKLDERDLKSRLESAVHEIQQLREQLAAEREKMEKAKHLYSVVTREFNLATKELEQLRQQLATEREQGVKVLAERSFELHTTVEALKRVKSYVESTTQALGELSTEADVDALNLIDAALARIGGGKSR